MAAFGDERRLRAELESRLGPINGFLNASSWVGAYQTVLQHPELLDDLTLDLVAELGETSRGAGRLDYVRVYEQLGAVLERCSEIGVEATFAELERVRKLRPPDQPVTTTTGDETSAALRRFMEGDGLDAVDVLEQHPELISEASVQRLDDYIAHFRQLGDERSAHVLEVRRDYLRSLLD